MNSITLINFIFSVILTIANEECNEEDVIDENVTWLL